MTFEKKLKALRKKNRMSQEEMAERLNVSRQAISKWELGSIPDRNNLCKISSFFDCSLDYLLNDSDELVDERTRLENEQNMPEKKEVSVAASCQTGTLTIERGLFVVSMLAVIGLAVIYIFSITFPAPVFRCDMESKQWIVGIRGFIEYHNLFGIINVLFIAILVGVIGLYVIKEKKLKREYHTKKAHLYLLLTFLAILLGVVFAYCRFMIINVLVWDFTVITIALVYTMLLTGCIVRFQYYVRRKEKEEERPTTEN